MKVWPDAATATAPQPCRLCQDVAFMRREDWQAHVEAEHGGEGGDEADAGARVHEPAKRTWRSREEKKMGRRMQRSDARRTPPLWH